MTLAHSTRSVGIVVAGAVYRTLALARNVRLFEKVEVELDEDRLFDGTTSVFSDTASLLVGKELARTFLDALLIGEVANAKVATRQTFVRIICGATDA